MTKMITDLSVKLECEKHLGTIQRQADVLPLFLKIQQLIENTEKCVPANLGDLLPNDIQLRQTTSSSGREEIVLSADLHIGKEQLGLQLFKEEHLAKVCMHNRNITGR